MDQQCCTQLWPQWSHCSGCLGQLSCVALAHPPGLALAARKKELAVSNTLLHIGHVRSCQRRLGRRVMLRVVIAFGCTATNGLLLLTASRVEIHAPYGTLAAAPKGILMGSGDV